MKKKPIAAISALIAIIGYLSASEFIDVLAVKIITIIISAIPSAYQVLNVLWKDAGWMISLNRKVRNIPLIGLFVPKDEVNISSENYKPAFLERVAAQCEIRLKGIKSLDIFTNDFEVEPIFIPGSKQSDTYKDWQLPARGKRFNIITGEAGSGKSFELIKRVKIMCDALKSKLEADIGIEKEILPLYIELGALNKVMDDNWLETYVYKTYNLLGRESEERGVKIPNSYVQAVLENKEDIAFFFDGFDEIPESYRLGSLKYIITLATRASVTISCRKNVRSEQEHGYSDQKNVYEELNTFFFEEGRRPAEYYIAPMSRQQMLEVIDRLDKKEPEKAEMKVFITRKTKDIPFNKDWEVYARAQDLENPHSRSIVFALFVKVYTDLPDSKKEELLHADLDQMLDILWSYYEDFAMRKAPVDADILGMRAYAVFIAKIMEKSAFYIESVQPDWLRKVKGGDLVPTRSLKIMYYLTTRIVSAVMVGFALELIACTPLSLLSNSILGGIIISLLAGIYKSIPKGKFSVLVDCLFVIVMLSVLVGACSLYQGFSVPRYVAQGEPKAFSIYETWPGMLLGLILSIVFSYRIIVEKKTNKYVQPVNRFQFRPVHAIGYALLGGLASAIIVGAAGWYVWYQSPETLFMQNWLVPEVKVIWHDKFDKILKGSELGLAIFLYGFTVAFTVVSILVVVLVGRYEGGDETELAAAKQQLQFGITAWAGKAFRRAFIILLISGAIYYGAMLMLHMQSWFHFFKIAFGAAVASFLWFGGMEAFNHVLLRFSLWIRGIIPNRYDEWIDTNLKMALIRPQGYKMAFYHPTLAKYYSNQKLVDNARIRVKRAPWKDGTVYGLALISLFSLLLLPFAMRYWWKLYWPDPYQVHIAQHDLDKVKWRFLDSGTYQVGQTDTVVLRANGRIQVGTFVGLVLSPGGTREGYMGMPLKSSYNLPQFDTSYAHAALLVRQWHSSKKIWDKYEYIHSKTQDSLLLQLIKGDRVQFIVNDKEYQNNLGKYTLTIDRNTFHRKK